MALDIVADQSALHSTSKQISNHIKSRLTSSRLDSLWEAPSYSTASSKELEPVIPSPNIFKDFFNTSGGNDCLPSNVDCAVHLEFLAALHALRHRVLESDKLDEVFDIKPLKKTVTRRGTRVELKDNTLWTRRQVKWEKYVNIAVVRFRAWWEAVPETIELQDGHIFPLADNTLPPLDVLMVWHSFLLNPRWFRRSCGDGKRLLYKIDFPWASIHARINQNDWSLTPSKLACEKFQEKTSHGPDLFEVLLEWRSYPADDLESLLEATSYSLEQSGLSAIRNKIKYPDQRLLQRFVDTPQELARDLNDAVLRQVSFVDKMWDKLWIRSPALDGTIRRARDRYSNFLKLFKLYPTTMFVPTLDIDLVWHTHQCSPSQYYTTTKEVAGKFVNHDDSTVQKELDTGLKNTKSLYRMRFGQEYHICGCWDCEALQSAIEEGGKKPDWEGIAQQVGEDVAYHRAVEVARRTKNPIPIR